MLAVLILTTSYTFSSVSSRTGVVFFHLIEVWQLTTNLTIIFWKETMSKQIYYIFVIIWHWTQIWVVFQNVLLAFNKKKNCNRRQFKKLFSHHTVKNVFNIIDYFFNLWILIIKSAGSLTKDFEDWQPHGPELFKTLLFILGDFHFNLRFLYTFHQNKYFTLILLK